MFSNCSEMLILGTNWTTFFLRLVNKLAGSITKWTNVCDKRLNRLTSDIHHTCEYKQYCHVGNTAKQCRLGLFQDSDFAGDLGETKSTSGGTLCVFGSHTFVPISWDVQGTNFSFSQFNGIWNHLDAGLRLDARDLWDLIVAVLHGNTCQWTNPAEHAPMKLRSDFRDAVTSMHHLFRESGEERPVPILVHPHQRWHSSSSSSTSWWQWNENWWRS